MRPSFMGFESAKSAIFANQKSIDIVGNNLSNVNTAGYTRQRVDRASMVAPTHSSRIGSSNIGLLGQGVDTLGVSQTRDEFLDMRFRQEYSNAGYHGQSSAILNSIQGALGDGADITDESGLYSSMQGIYESLNNFMQDPTSDSQANLVMSAFKDISQVLQQIDSNLSNVAKQYTEDLGVDIEHVNNISAQIAHLNDVISKDASSVNTDGNHYGPNELLDQRNLLLDELASYGNISTTEMPDGSISVSLGDHEIVNGGEYDKLELATNKNGTVGVQWVSTGDGLSTSSGTLLGSVHFINGSGNDAKTGEEPYKGIPYYKDQMDTFASALVDVVNNTVPELGDDGKPKVDVNGNVVYKTLLGAKQLDGTISPHGVTADNITISSEWQEGGPGYFIFNKDENVEDYAQQLASKLTEQKYTFSSNGETYEGTFTDFEVNILGTLGSDISFHSGRQGAYANVANDFLNQRDSIAGVNSDEETADMLKYQKSYEAASRVMTTLDELLDVVINRMGRVGL